jgi:hypothetical protein
MFLTYIQCIHIVMYKMNRKIIFIHSCNFKNLVRLNFCPLQKQIDFKTSVFYLEIMP